ncbi:RING zinc finger-containing protein [Heterostelium album PN500]|uniref:RCR-type E3 ubiquitin transferase n=1 Tax=Heterostelium pallidum (strain ATCC 26659 / Pp 5 / PN500) TaxID=670386 RepID=D3BT62_HETP5|nr:RING zinc finger-containing protein [Heterostelium album PN500]EFA75279.1 RING zinc finger-containing protein [Heterostelium album PN500]|eukprot:XP_020427413.1 RING zinc finger-containing protein [Heterostelium album PN500]
MAAESTVVNNNSNSNSNSNSNNSNDNDIVYGLADTYSINGGGGAINTPTTTATKSSGGEMFEGVQLDRFLKLYNGVLKHSNYYDNIDAFEDDDDDDGANGDEKEGKESGGAGGGDDSEDDDSDKEKEKKKKKKEKEKGKKDGDNQLLHQFQSIKSSIPMSHSNALLHMKQILWHHPISLLPDKLNLNQQQNNIKQQQQQQQVTDENNNKQTSKEQQQQEQEQQKDGEFNSLESIRSSELFFQFLFDLLNDKNDMMKYRAFQLLQDYCKSLPAASIGNFAESLIKHAVSTLTKIIDTTSNTDNEHMVASSALISLVVARDDPSLTFKIIRFILNSKYQSFLPSNLKPINENYVPLEKFDFKKSVVYEASSNAGGSGKLNIGAVYSMATDGVFIFVHCDLGLLKLSLGQQQQQSLLQYKVVQWKKDYHLEGDDDSSQPSSSSSTPSASCSQVNSIHSWMFVIGSDLYFRSTDMANGIIAQLNIDNLEEESFVSVEAGDCPLGQYPYTMFLTTTNNNNSNSNNSSNNNSNNSSDNIRERLVILELVNDLKKSVFPETRLRYLSLVDGAFVQDGPSHPLPLWSKTTKIQQVNCTMVNEKQDDSLLSTIESYQISKIYASVKGGFYFLSEDKNLYYLGKSELDKLFKPPYVDIAQSNIQLYIVNKDGVLGRITDMKANTLKTFDSKFKVKTMVTTGGEESGCYLVDDTPDACLHSAMSWDSELKKVELPGGEETNQCTLLVAANHSNVVVVNASGIYVKGNNVFGQLGLGHFKNSKEFTRLSPASLPFDVTDVEKIEIGLTFTLFLVRDGVNRRIYYSGNIKGLKQSNHFVEYQHHDFHASTKSIESIIDICATDHGFIVLKQTMNVDIDWATLTFGDINVFADRKCLGVLIPPTIGSGADNNSITSKTSDYLLYNTVSNPPLQLVSKSKVAPRKYRFHLSKVANFEFNTESQQLVMLDNREGNRHPYNSRVSLTNPRERVDPLVIINTLLETYSSTAKPKRLSVPSLSSEFIQSLPKMSFTIAKFIIKEGLSSRVSTTFVKVNRPVLLWSLQLVRSRECLVMLKIESDSTRTTYSQQHRVVDSKIELDYPFELLPNVGYKITIISTEIDSILPGSAYSVFSVGGVQFDLTPSVEYKQIAQVVHGLTFSPLTSSIINVGQSTHRQKSIPKDALIDLLDSLSTMWSQFSGSIEMHKTLQNGAKEHVVDTLMLLDEPLNRTITILARHIQVLLDDVVQGTRVISLIHSVYHHRTLFTHRQHDHKVFIAFMESINHLFVKAFPYIYSTPLQQASAINIVYQLIQLGGSSSFPGAPYLLTAMIQSLYENDVKSLIDIVCEDDAFTRESIDPSLVAFYDMLQNEIYQLHSSSKKKSQKQRMDSSGHSDSGLLFKDVIMSIASNKPFEQPDADNNKLDDYRSKSIDLLKFIWSSSMIVKNDDVVFNQPKVHSVGRFNSTSSSWSYDEMMDAISFKADADIYITGIGLYGDKGSYSARVGVTLGQSAQSFNSTNSVNVSWSNKTARYIHRIDLPEPFQLGANEIMTVFTKISGPSSSSGYKGKESASAEGVNFKFMTSRVNSDNGTSLNSGQIPTIFFQFEPNYRSMELTPKIFEDTLIVSKMILERSKTILKELAQQRQASANEMQLEDLRNDRFLQSLLPFIIDSYANVKYKSIDKQQKLATFLDFLDSTTKINALYKPTSKSLDINDSASSQHCIKMESSHPYEECTKQTNVVEFPADIKWMTIQFDSRSVTTQSSDRLFIWLNGEYKTPLVRSGFSEKEFPSTTFIVPGNKLIFDFQSASNPANFNDANRYGYSASVIGYKTLGSEDSDYPLAKLERLLSFYILQLSSSSFFDQKERGFISEAKQKSKAAAAAAGAEKAKRKKRRVEDSDSSDSDSDDGNEDEKEAAASLSNDDDEKELDFDKIIVDNNATNREEAKSKLYFKTIWNKLSKKLVADSKHQYGISDQVLLDFVNAKSGTLGEEVSDFFNSIGMAVLNKKVDEKDKRKDDRDKKKDDKKKDAKEKAKDKEKNDKKDGDEDDNSDKAEGEEGDKKKEKKPEDKFKDFPINSDDLLSVSEKLRLRRLALLMKRKKHLAKEWKNQKKNLENEKYNDYDSSDSDTDSDESEESEAEEEEDSWDEDLEDDNSDDDEKENASDDVSGEKATGKEEEGTDIEEGIKVNIKENGSATEDKDSDDEVKIKDDNDDNESNSSDNKVKTSTVDNSLNQSKPEEESIVDAAAVHSDSESAIGEDDKKIVQASAASNEKESITSFLKYTGWDTIMKKLFVEIIRLNGAESDFVLTVQSIKNQKKSLQEAKESEQLTPYVELWRNVQKRLNKWALQQSTVAEEYVGINILFGDDDDYFNAPPEPITKKDVLPIQKLDFLFEFLSHLSIGGGGGSSASSSAKDQQSSSSSSSESNLERRSINYSFEEFMNSSNINTSTYNLLLLNKNSQDSAGNANEKVHNSFVSRSILAMFLENFIKIDFFDTIEETKRKNLVKIDSLKIWSNLVETLQVPSALENTIWMIATIVHTNQAPKALLPADWQGKVAQNLSITSNINPLLKREFIVQFHALLEALSKRIKFGSFSDAIILNALSCFSMYLLPEDISFVQSSEIFPLISKILSELHSNETRSLFSPMRKGKEKITPQELDYIEQQQQSESGSVSSNNSPLTSPPSNSSSFVPIQNSSFVNIANKCKVVLTKSPEMMPSLFDESTQSFWEASAKAMINVTLPGEKPTFVQEVCVYIDNSDNEYQVMTVKIKAGNSESCIDFSKVIDVEHEANYWKIIPIGQTITNINISFTGSESIRVRQLKILIPDKQENMSLSPNSKFDATLSLLKLLTFQIFGISTSKEISKDLRNQVATLLSSNGVSKIQKQIFSLISSEVQKEIIHLDGIGWNNVKDQPNKDAYLNELLTTLSSLMESEEGKSFIPSKSSIFALLPLLHKGAERIQHLCINICKGMLINLKPTLFTEFMQEQSNVTVSNLSFIQYMLLIISKPIYVQVKGGSNPLAHNYTMDSLLPNVLEGELSIANGKALIELVKDLMNKSESWRQSIEDELVNSILSMRVAATQPINTYLNSTKLWSALSALLIVFGNQKVISTINTSNISSETQVKTCQNHDDGVTEASVLCNNCQTNLCSECDRFVHMPKAKREHVRSPLVNDVISLEVHENCIRLKLSSTLFVLDCEKQKAIVQTINISSSETCRFCKQKLDLQNLIPSHGISGVCSSADCKQKAANSCTKIHQCGHLCYGIRDEDECLPCLHGCKKPELITTTTSETTTTTTTSEHSHSSKCKKLTQDQDDFCMICWTENLSEAPSIQLDCGHVFHQDCCKQLLEKRWNGARITLGFSKCPICKTSIHHQSLKSITDVIDNIGNEIIRKGKLRIDFLGIQKDPLLLPGGKYHQNLDGYIMDQFAYYLCFKCKQPYFGGSNQCAAAMAAPEKFNPEELICGGCSSDDVLPICPKHGKDYLEFKCRYCCSVAIWFCFGTHHFCETCHNHHTELTSRNTHPQCPVGPGGIELPGDDCPLHVDHPKTGTEFALGCGICRNVREF